MASFYDLLLLSYDLVLKVMPWPIWCKCSLLWIFSVVFDIYDESSYPRRFKCIRQWIKCNCWTVTPYRSYDVLMYDVIAGHENIYINNSSQNRGRTVDEVSLCLSREDALTDLQYDLPGSFIRSGHLTWSKVKFSNWPFGVKMHMFRCILTRGIRWCFAFFSIFLGSKVICKKNAFPKKQHFLFNLPLEGQNVTKVGKSGMVRFRTSRSFRLSFLRSSISIRGQTTWGCPPPQVRSGKAK